MVLRVVQRSVEPPSDKGWGSNELVRVTTSAGTGFGSYEIDYAARVKRRYRGSDPELSELTNHIEFEPKPGLDLYRRYRRSYSESGERVIEGLEIVKTYRVLDGIAGTTRTRSLTLAVAL